LFAKSLLVRFKSKLLQCLENNTLGEAYDI
jgi:hypothetical protein